jgi:predicted ATPase/transcriptional regulator with XRE-family HTH domain/tetratricopeptide (TPR) repeat protein
MQGRDREMSSFGTLLRQLRLTAGLTQEALAERSGLSAKAVGELERSPDRTPRLETVTLLAEALELSSDDRARLLAASRPQDGETLSTSQNSQPRHDLPRVLTPLIGRAGALEAVASLALRRENQVVTLTGPGGVGKTRLAIAVAERVAAAFADGVVFVDLSPVREPALVLPAIAQHLGVDERGELSLNERLASALRGKRLLLVLDNLEHLVVVGADLLGLLSHSQGLVILATSRVPLRVRGEREYRVAPLELPLEAVSAGEFEQSASVALFLDRVRAAGLDLRLDHDTALAVAEICRRLDGLPLALELAAAWVPLLPPVALLERLNPRLPLLIRGPADLPARQRTMFDAIAWSYDLLDPAEQRLFRRMAVFAGGCTPEAAVAVCADEEERVVLAKLAALVDKNLLRRDESSSGTASPRLFMLETIREYGLERLAENEDAQALRWRHAEFFLRLMEDAALALGGRNQIIWAARLELDHDNVRAALSWVCDQVDAGTGLRFAAALWRFWSTLGHGREAQRWLERILDLPVLGAEASEDAVARVRAQTGAAVLALESGALDDAGAKIAGGVTRARELNDQRVLVDTLNAAGLIARTQGEYDTAVTFLEEAYQAALAEEYRPGEATAIHEIAMITFLAGDAARARELLERSIALYRELEDTRGLAVGLRDLGWMTWHAGNAARGEELREEALSLFRALGDTGQVAETLWALGISSQYRGDDARATDLYQESLLLRRSRGDDRGVAQVLSTLAQVALHRRDLHTARTMLTESLDTVRRFNDRWAQAMVLALLGHVELVSGHLVNATEYFSEAAARYAEIGNLLYLPWCLEGFAGVAIAETKASDAAFLIGARESMLELVGQGLPPADPLGFATTQAIVRDALGETAFVDAYEAGRSLSPENVITLTVQKTQNQIDAIQKWIDEGAPKN